MYIEDTLTLASLCRELSEAPYIALDTEFLRDKSYYPQLCLVQVAHGSYHAAIDTLAPNLDLSPLWELLTNPKILKVLHAAGQDLELFLNVMGRLPSPLFDTQVAAMVCGFGDQIGYSRLVQQICSVKIAKNYQLTDWSRRPLSSKQIDYALSDVIYLCSVYEVLSGELYRSGREAWVEEEFEDMLREEKYVVDDREAYKRVKMSHPSSESLSILRELAAWRERLAKRQNRPRAWIIKDQALIEMAQTKPRSKRELRKVRGLDSKYRDSKAQVLLDLIQKGLDCPASKRPELPAKGPKRRVDNSLIALLQALLKIRCDEHDVAPRLVATRDELEALVLMAGDNKGRKKQDQKDLRSLRGWRNEVFGQDAQELIAGRLGLTWRKGRATVIKL